MTDRVHPTIDQTAEARTTAVGAIQFAGGSGEGWIVPAADSPGNLAADDADIDETQLDAFSESSSGSSLDVTINPGEAFIGGAWLARDITTTVSLAASTNGQTVYVGWDVDASNQVIVGLSSAFDADDPKHSIWTFDTDGSGVTSTTDERNLDDYRIRTADVEQGAGSGLDADFLRGNAPLDLLDPIYGDGSDGSITRSSNGNENGVLNVVDYTIQSGVTRTVSNGTLVIHAQDSITISGTLDGSGADGGGGSGGTVTSATIDGGDGGEAGAIVVLVAPKITISGTVTLDGGNGLDGGDGGSTGVDRTGNSGSNGQQGWWDGGGTGGSGGSGGGNGSNGTSPGGGGGGGSESDQGRSGGSGGDCPSPSLSSQQRNVVRTSVFRGEYDEVYTLSVRGGSDGGGGGSGSADTNGNEGGGGGGGGGCGGVLVLVGRSVDTSSGTISTAGGSGGTGGTGSGGGDGGDGANGNSGTQITINV